MSFRLDQERGGIIFVEFLETCQSLPPRLGSSLCQIELSQVEIGRRQPGVETNGLLQESARLGKTSISPVQGGEFAERLWILWLQFELFLIGFFCFGGASLNVVQAGDELQGAAVAWIELQGAAGCRCGPAAVS